MPRHRHTLGRPGARVVRAGTGVAWIRATVEMAEWPSTCHQPTNYDAVGMDE
jgi:hypothetical protein